MANMGYCRFQNTVTDLQDCYDALESGEADDLGDDEARARSRLIELCSTIHHEYGENDSE